MMHVKNIFIQYVMVFIVSFLVVAHVVVTNNMLYTTSEIFRKQDNDVTIDYGNVAICSVVKSESSYLDEWTDYYLSIGVDQIFIYDNSEQYVLEKWQEESCKRNSITIIFYPGRGVQRAVYADCAKRVRQHNFSWVFFTDVDEFLVLKKHVRVDQFLSEYCINGALSINWRVFGTNGHKIYKPIPVLRRFQLRLLDDDPINLYVKSIVRSCDLKVLPKFYRSPHLFPLLGNRSHRDTNGEILKSHLHKGPTDLAAIYHFRFKSYEEYYRNKVPRGSVFYGGNGGDIALRWDPLPNGSIFDDLAWKILLSNVPRYRFYN
jgi:Glycosyl transferase family 2